MIEEPTKCPICGRWSVYDYNGVGVCQYCYNEAVKDCLSKGFEPKTIDEIVKEELSTRQIERAE